MNEEMEMTFTIEDADLDKLYDVVKEINVMECPWFEVQDKHGNKAKYFREPRWIPCTERLPDVGGAILLSDGNEIVIGEYYGDNTWKVEGCDYDPILEEIAWMPLPRPFMKEGEQG